MASAKNTSADRSRPPGRGRLFTWFATLAMLPLVAACDLIEARGKAVYEACLYDPDYAHTSQACQCYVDEVSRALAREDWYRYHEMAGRGFYADRERLRTAFPREQMGVFERAARRCRLDLFAPEEAIVVPGPDGTTGQPGYVPGGNITIDPAAAYGPSQEYRYGRSGYGRGRDAFPAEPWPYVLQETDPRPICIRGFGYGERCMTREQAARLYNDGARYWLLRGDAELATVDLQRGTDWLGLRGPRQGAEAQRHDRDRNHFAYDSSSVRLAMEYWNHSIDWGRAFGAQSALMAQRRLQAHMVQCESSPDGESLARISRRGPEETGDVISLELRQAALASLGYYSAPVDGHYGPATRDAVRGFQRELGYDETGSLTPRQTTLLICHAAQTARDPHLQNALGIMYATGLGVARNADLSLEWFETAARRDDADAFFNLALVYGTGAVLGSYRLCGLIENPERADAYLRDAAALGHPVAERWRRHPEFRRHPTAESRWLAISNRLEEAAANGDGDFYLEWRTHIDVDRFSSADLACLEPEGGTRDPF